MECSFGVRKGTWTRDEDVLLKQCVEKYGDGKWHLVPARAGLNRCRKSCRLRWLNYLKPDIKRGEFAADEIDLILRLHKLLGNRWSLIAGRIPGRTANDVKNYWNTHLRKKFPNCDNKKQMKDHNNNNNDNNFKKIVNSKIIKPRPRRFSKPRINKNNNAIIPDNIPPSEPSKQEEMKWWESLLLDDDTTSDEGGLNSKSCTILKEQPIGNFLVEEFEREKPNNGDFSFLEDQENRWKDLSVDIDQLWDFTEDLSINV